MRNVEHIFGVNILACNFADHQRATFLPLRKEFNKIIRDYPSVNKSNRGGYQSPDIEVNRAGPYIQGWFQQVEEKISDFAKECFKPTPQLSIQSFWINQNNKGDYNIPHNHPKCLFAGVYYMDAPRDCGRIILEAPYADTVEYGAVENYFHTQYRIPVKKGLLLIFPSWIKHSVETSNSDQKRTSIAFNIGT